MKLWGGHGGGAGRGWKREMWGGCDHISMYPCMKLAEKWKMNKCPSLYPPPWESGQKSMEACRSGSDLSWTAMQMLSRLVFWSDQKQNLQSVEYTPHILISIVNMNLMMLVSRDVINWLGVMLPYKYHPTMEKPYLKSGATAGQQFPADGTHPHQARQCGDRQAAEQQ